MKKILCSLLLLCLLAGTAAAQSLFADLPEGEIILTFKDIARELSRGWQQTCPRPNGTNLIINIPVELPETQQLSVISVSPQPAFSPSLLTRYIPDAQENIRNDPGDFFQFYGGERTDHIIRSASRSEEIFSDRLPKVEFMHGMTFRDLRMALNDELLYLTGEQLPADALLTGAVSHYTDVDILTLIYTQRMRGLPTPYGGWLTMQSWNASYHYLSLSLYQEDGAVIESLPLSSFRRVQETVAEAVAAGSILDVLRCELVYEDFDSGDGQTLLIPLWRVLARTRLQSATPEMYWFFDVQTGERIEVDRTLNPYPRQLWITK